MTNGEIGTTSLPVVGYDFLTPLLGWFFGHGGLITSVSVADVIGFFGIIWTIVVVLGYLTAFLFLYLYIYASIQLEKLEDIASEQLRAHEKAFAGTKGVTHLSGRLAELRNHVNSADPKDWKLAIIEADIILDETLKRQGYAGTSLGERLRSISPSALASLDEAWQAHKIRNQIAHGGADFVLTHKIAQDTILRYGRVFTELGVG